MVKKSPITQRMGELSYVNFNPFSGIGEYQWKRAPTRVFLMLLDSLKLKEPSSIYFLVLTKNPRDHTTMVSLDTTPQKTVWQHSHFGSPLFRVLYNVSFLDSINIKSVYLPQVFPICSYIPSITAMIPFPWVLSLEWFLFVSWSALPSYSEQRKFESPMIPCPYSTSPPPPCSGSVLRFSHIFWLSPSCFYSRKHHWLGQL